MLMRMRAVAALSCLAVGLSTSAQAQDDVPIVLDMPETETVSDGRSLDILGVRLGAKFADAVEALTQAAGNKPKIESGTTGVGDNRGNEVNFPYTKRIKAGITDTPGSYDEMLVFFSTGLSGHRVQRIERFMGFREQQASIPDFQKSLIEKYGTPSLIVESQAEVKIYYVWFNGKRAGSGEVVGQGDPRVSQIPFSCASSFPVYSEYMYGDTFQRTKGCDTVVRIELTRGARNDLARQIRTNMLDMKRYWADKSTADSWLDAELEKVIAGKAGVAPRL